MSKPEPSAAAIMKMRARAYLGRGRYICTKCCTCGCWVENGGPEAVEWSKYTSGQIQWRPMPKLRMVKSQPGISD